MPSRTRRPRAAPATTRPTRETARSNDRDDDRQLRGRRVVGQGCGRRRGKLGGWQVFVGNPLCKKRLRGRRSRQGQCGRRRGRRGWRLERPWPSFAARVVATAMVAPAVLRRLTFDSVFFCCVPTAKTHETRKNFRAAVSVLSKKSEMRKDFRGGSCPGRWACLPEITRAAPNNPQPSRHTHQNPPFPAITDPDSFFRRPSSHVNPTPTKSHRRSP